jgi:hypothetical protein
MTPEPEKQQEVATPMTCRAVRRIHRVLKRDVASQAQNLELILRAHEKLAAQHSIDRHEIKGLVIAIKLEKKKRRRGAKLNLVGEEKQEAEFYSPSRVQQALELYAAKEANEQLRKEGIAQRKATAIATREKKAADKAAQALERQVQRQLAQEKKAQLEKEKALKKVDREAQKDLNQVCATSKAPIRAKKPLKRKVDAHVEVVEVDRVAKRAKTITASGRAIKVPHRFEI